MRRLATEPDRIDWFRVLADLQRHGVPVSQASAATRIPKSTLLGWRQGAEPKYADGEKLLALWCGICQREVSDVPRVGK